MNTLDLNQLKTHVPIVAWLLIIGSALWLLIGGFIFLLLVGIGIAVDDPTALKVLSVVGTALAIFLVSISIPGLVAGCGLLARRSWARILAIVVSFISLLNVPIGTIFGVYAAWVLLQEQIQEYFHPKLTAG
jgi:hypothetical protein